MNIKTLTAWLPFRDRKGAPTLVVLHASAGPTASGAIAWLRKIKLSYHYIIDLDGTVLKCVPTSKVAFHAGVSQGPDGPNANGYSVGICLVGMNEGALYTQAQYLALNNLLADLERAMPSLRQITTHYALTVNRDGSYRKSDPRALAVAFVKTRLLWWKPSYAKAVAL